MTSNNVEINVKINSENTKIKDLNKSLEDTSKATTDLKKKTDEATESNRGYVLSLLHITESLTSIGATLGKLSFKAITEPIKEDVNGLKHFAIGLGATAAAATAVEGVFSQRLLRSFSDLNDEMSNVNSILFESPKGFNKLNENVRDLSLNLKLATETQIAKGLYDVASAGFTGAQGIQVLDTAIKASKAGRADLRESAQLIAQSLNALDLGAENSEKIANILFKTIQDGSLEFKDLNEGLGRVLPNLKALEQPLEVAGAALTIMTNKGAEPAEAITNLNSLLLAFSAQSEESKKKAFELGIQMDSNAVKTKGVVKVLEEMVAAAKKTGDLNSTLFTLVGRQEALNAVLQLSNIKQFAEQIDKTRTASTALNNSLNEQSKSISTQFDKVKVGLEAIKTQAGGLIGDLAGKFIPVVGGLINEFNSLSESARKTILIFAGIVAATPAIVAGFGAATLGITLLVAQLLISRFLLTTFLTLMKPIVAVTLAVAGALKTAAVAMYEWTTATTVGAGAMGTLRGLLVATVSSLGAYVLILGSAAAAVGVLTYEIIKLDQAQEEQRRNEQRNYDLHSSSIKTINELRQKEKSGYELTSKEQEKYAKALVSLYGTNKILREEAEKRIKISKELAEQEAKEGKVVGYTDEQKKKRKEIFDNIADIEAKSKDDLTKAKREATKERDKELKELKDALALKLITQEEYNKESIKVQNSYNDSIKKATDKYNEEQERKRKEALKKAHEIIAFEQELILSIQKNTLDPYSYQREEAKKNKTDRLYELTNKDLSSTQFNKEKLLIEKEYQSTLNKIKSDELKDLKNYQDQFKAEEANRKHFLQKISDDILKINATDKEKAKIDNKEKLASLYAQYEAEKKIMSEKLDIYGKKANPPEKIKEFSDNFSQFYKTLEKSLNKEVDKIDFAKPQLDAIKEIQDKLQEFALEEDQLRGDRIKAERRAWEEVKKIAQKALEDKTKLTKEDQGKFETDLKESNSKIKSLNREEENLRVQGIKNITKAIEDVSNELGLFDKNASSATIRLLDNVDSLTAAFSALKTNGLDGLFDFAKSGGDLSGLQAFLTLAITQIKSFVNDVKSNLRQINSTQDLLETASDIGTGFGDTITMGLSKTVRDLFGQKTFKEMQDSRNKMKELSIQLLKDRDEQKRQMAEFQKSLIMQSTQTEEEKNLNIRKINDDLSQYFKEETKKEADLDIKLTSSKIDQIDKWYKSEQQAIKDSGDNYELQTKRKIDLDNQYFTQKSQYFLELSKLEHTNENFTADEATKAINKAKDDLAELEAQQQDQAIKEQKRLEIINTLNEALKNIKENYFSNISSLMQKYYDKELNHIKANHKAEYDLIQLNQQKIKANQDKIDSLNYELDKINAEFDKLLNDKTLSANASANFAQARNAFINQNGGTDVSALIRTPVDEFQRQIAAKKEQIDLEFSQTGDVQKRADALKELAVQQNVYWSELAKTLVQGTKEYDEYVKNANDGFRDYKTATKDSLEAAKQNRIENEHLTDQIKSLTDENKTLQKQSEVANSTITQDIDNLTSKFKDSTGEWITDINKARQALQGISTDSQNAIASLNKITTANTVATNTNVNTVTPTTYNSTSSASASTSSTSNLASKYYADALPNETVDQYIARITYQDAMVQTRAGINAVSASTGGSVSAGTIYGNADFSNSIPTANYTDFASGSITSASANIGLFDQGGALGWLNPSNWGWFAEGGISSGSEKGYPAMLHGKELILNESQGNNLAYLLKMANTKPPSNNYSNNSNIVFAPVISGSNLNQDQLKSVIKDTFADLQKQQRMAYGSY